MATKLVKTKERKGCTVIMYSTSMQDQRENNWFIHKLRTYLAIRIQSGPEKTINQSKVDKESYHLVRTSKVTVLHLTKSIVDAKRLLMFNEGRSSYDARCKAGKKLIPVMMPQFPETRYKEMVGRNSTKSHDPFKFEKGWEQNKKKWIQFANIIKMAAGTRHLMEINLLELFPCVKSNPCCTSAILNRKLPGKDISQQSSLQLVCCRQCSYK